MTALNILSGGAAQGLIASLAPQFKAQTGLDITGEFGAVGAMADKLRSGTKADIIILTAAIIARLAEERWVVPASIADIGLVETAVAVRTGDSMVKVNDEAGLRDALRAADAIFVPDIKASTAGIHVASAATRHRRQVASRFDLSEWRDRDAPSGETDALRPIGCTQSTGLSAPKARLIGLARGYDLSTMYTAAVAHGPPTRAGHACRSVDRRRSARDANTRRLH
jgi:molybdate transport system substrate-binding protein